MNKTTTFIVGNGVGMALNSEHFSINKGLDVAWKETKSRNVKSMIYHSLGKKRKPQNETDLQTVQQYFFDLKYVEERISSFPPLIRKKFGDIHKISDPYFGYLFDVAKHFFNYDVASSPHNIKEKFDNFIINFAAWIDTSKNQQHINHVVTLNYDALLFRAFLQKGLFNRLYKLTHLVDGITNSGYNPNNMRLLGDNLFGWYIHLHGSPRFFTGRDGNIHKDTSKSAFDEIDGYVRGREHIILCDPAQKYERIKHSLILSSYFDFFEKAIQNSCSIVLLGYGGKDKHINEVISKYPEKSIYIVEWSGRENEQQEPLEGYENQRKIFWRNQLNRSDESESNSITLYHKDSIFDFDFFLLNPQADRG